MVILLLILRIHNLKMCIRIEQYLFIILFKSKVVSAKQVGK